jgi:RNA polymerase sigma-70 factor (ECF subfamily)
MPEQPATAGRAVADNDDLAALYVAEFPGLLRTAFAICGNAARAEEVVHDAFVSAHRRWDRVGQFDRPGAWLRRAVINGSISHTRRVRHEARALLRLANRPAGAEPLIGSAESDDALWAAVRALPAKQRAAVALYYVDDLPVDDIAEALNCSASTVRVHLSRARIRLAERLAPPSAATALNDRPDREHPSKETP